MEDRAVIVVLYSHEDIYGVTPALEMKPTSSQPRMLYHAAVCNLQTLL